MIGRPIALSAFFTPILSTVQNNSKKSSSASVMKPIAPGNHPVRVLIPLDVFENVKSDLDSGPRLDLPSDAFGNEHLILERPDLEASLLIENADQGAGDFGDHFRAVSFQLSAVSQSAVSDLVKREGEFSNQVWLTADR